MTDLCSFVTEVFRNTYDECTRLGRVWFEQCSLRKIHKLNNARCLCAATNSDRTPVFKESRQSTLLAAVASDAIGIERTRFPVNSDW